MDHDPGRRQASENPRDAATENVTHLHDKARDAMTEAAEPLRQEAGATAEQQKAASADQIDRLGAAVHGAAGEIAKELPQAAQYVHSAADTLQNASSALRERSIEDLLGTFNRFAREQPLAAFAGSVLAGFALSRFLKSSSPEGHKHG